MLWNNGIHIGVLSLYHYYIRIEKYKGGMSVLYTAKSKTNIFIVMKQEFLIKLTPYQEAFYNEWKVNGSENEAAVILDQTIFGPLDRGRLNSSLVRFINDNLLVNSFMIKRSDGLFWQSIPLLSEDASVVMECDPEDVSELIRQPFDLENDRSARFYLARINDQQYRIVYMFSPALVDQLTDHFLCRELARYYNDPEYCHPIDLSEQARLLLELNAELNEILGNGKKRMTDFWKKHLRGMENTGFAFLETYRKHEYNNRVEIKGERLLELNIECSEEVYCNVKRLAETYKMTPYAYAQMVLAILLHRISKVGKLAINYPVSIKKQQDGILGSYVNTIPKAYYFTEETRLRDLINQNIEYVFNLWNIKADYLPWGDISYAPESDIFKFTFSQTHTKDDFIDYKDADDIIVNHPLRLTSYDHFLIEQEIKSGVLSYKIRYDGQHFDHELVSGFAAIYKNLFVSILDDLLHNKINYLISSYHLLDYERHHQVVHSWNDTVRPYSRDITVHGLFEAQTLKTPDHIALVFGDIKLSYKTLNEKSNQLAHYLIKKHNIQRDELIPICFDRSEHMVIGILGILKAGGAYVPMDPGYPLDRMEHIIGDTGARLVIGKGEMLDKLHKYQSPTRKRNFDVINLTDPETIHTIGECSKNNPVTETGPNDLAYVIYTSGTTGQPKGVMIEHSGVVNVVEFMSESHQFSTYRNVGCYSNYVFDAFVNEVFPVLCHGNTLWLFSNGLRISVDDLNHYIRDNDIEVSFIPPVLLKDLLPDTTLKLIFTGGENFPDVDSVLYRDIILLNEYGPTEVTVCATSHHYNKDGNSRNIGCAIHNTTVYVLDSYLRPVPVGVSGELYVGGVGVSRGYLNLPELTKERFLMNPFQTEEEKALGYNSRIYKTGDLARFLPNGDLEYIGRNDSQIEIGGGAYWTLGDRKCPITI